MPNLGIGRLEGLMAALELQPGEEPGRRGQIIRAAATVLGRAGYSDSSVKQIAHEAGVAPGLVHYYFTSKEELLVAVVHDLEREMVADWQSAVAGIEDPLGRIVAAVDHTAVRCSEHPEFFRLLFDLYVVGLNNPAIRERCVELWTHFVDDIEAEVRQVLGRLPGEATVPPRDLAEAIAGAIDGVALAGLLRESDPIDAYDALKSMLLSLVVTAYVQAGEEPPVARMRALLDRPRESGAAR
ncbi:MAG TPA: TetR/AcrR family transcriptional regulator [Candidatus Dormibacteraeota bacterium]|nr:TetR/AcrR family transcriptional regulator [Candidatus Dormibacteraeota bacterium]